MFPIFVFRSNAEIERAHRFVVIALCLADNFFFSFFFPSLFFHRKGARIVALLESPLGAFAAEGTVGYFQRIKGAAIGQSEEQSKIPFRRMVRTSVSSGGCAARNRRNLASFLLHCSASIGPAPLAAGAFSLNLSASAEPKGAASRMRASERSLLTSK